MNAEEARRITEVKKVSTKGADTVLQIIKDYLEGDSEDLDNFVIYSGILTKHDKTKLKDLGFKIKLSEIESLDVFDPIGKMFYTISW